MHRYICRKKTVVAQSQQQYLLQQQQQQLLAAAKSPPKIAAPKMKIASPVFSQQMSSAQKPSEMKNDIHVFDFDATETDVDKKVSTLPSTKPEVSVKSPDVGIKLKLSNVQSDAAASKAARRKSRAKNLQRSSKQNFAESSSSSSEDEDKDVNRWIFFSEFNKIYENKTQKKLFFAFWAVQSSPFGSMHK